MKIYNETKTQELNENELNFELGYLKKDKIVAVHHEATPFKKGRSAEEIFVELKEQGAPVIELNGIPYLVNHVYKDGEEVEITPELDLTDPAYGKSVTEIKAEPDAPAKEAWDDYEDIQVFVPYTEEELKVRADKKRYAELKAELEKVMEDIGQEQLGIVRDDYETKKARAAEIINELRVLNGKKPRSVRA